jgi:putative transposase
MFYTTVGYFHQFRSKWNFSLNQLYQTLQISKQAVHKGLKRMTLIKDEQLQLTSMIHKIRQDHPTMGIRDLYFKIKPQSMGRDQFEAFCKYNNFHSKKSKNQRKTTNSSGVIRFDNLAQNFTPTAIDQLWQSDITYFDLNNRFYYLTFIIDAFSRRIIGHSISNNLTTNCTTIPALKLAVKHRKKSKIPNLIFHSDGGGQYYAHEFLKLTQGLQIQNSMCQYPWENPMAERINGIIKNNYLKHWSIKNYEMLVKFTHKAVQLYNTDKPHIGLQRMSPINFEQLVVLSA